MNPCHLHTWPRRRRWLLQMTLGFGVPVFGQNFLHLKLESEIRTTETGRVVLACVFLKHDRISKLSTLITLTLCTSGSEFRVRGRRRDVGNSCRCVGLWEECGFAFSNHGLSKVIAFTAFSIQQR